MDIKLYSIRQEYSIIKTYVRNYSDIKIYSICQELFEYKDIREELFGYKAIYSIRQKYYIIKTTPQNILCEKYSGIMFLKSVPQIKIFYCVANYLDKKIY